MGCGPTSGGSPHYKKYALMSPQATDSVSNMDSALQQSIEFCQLPHGDVFDVLRYVLVQSFVTVVHATGIYTAIFTSWTLLFPSRPVVTVKELPAKKLFTMLQQETLTVPAT